MFQPVGTIGPTSSEAKNAPTSEYDIVAFLSANGYKAPGGIQLFNLSNAPTGSEPPDQYLALDIDYDGIKERQPSLNQTQERLR